MPELPDEMYCSQQIIVPPTFPYLLRQFAKAAIRSQPSDLLRWSTTYFRCLSLNLPPPVKPRLEYPIPKDYDGITPGWLRALLYQFLGSSHVDFKVLWDRWIGACLNHKTLIKILCLGGFTDPHAVPFLRFLALCAGFISESLTQTMILVCEIITDEPEGGSASITGEVFTDIYVFLAGIEASKGQILLNQYFTDDLLGLYEKEKEKPPEAKPPPPKPPSKESTETQVSIEEEELRDDGPKDAISCPDLLELENAELKSGSEDSISVSEVKADSVTEYLKQQIEGDEHLERDDLESVSTIVSDKLRKTLSEKFLEPHEEEENEEGEEYPRTPQEDEGGIGEGVRIEEVLEQGVEMGEAEETQSDMSREGGGSSFYDMLADGKSQSDQDLVEEESAPCSEEIQEEVEEEEEMMSKKSVSKFELEEIFVEAIPGIGAVVPIELVETVVEYVKGVTPTQHGMFMPRNIRHYSCPPLEVLD